MAVPGIAGRAHWMTFTGCGAPSSRIALPGAAHEEGGGLDQAPAVLEPARRGVHEKQGAYGVSTLFSLLEQLDQLLYLFRCQAVAQLLSQCL
jgi:hypothetical protein